MLQPTETVELYVAARGWQQRSMSFWTVLLVCGVHINIDVTLNLLFACVLVVDTAGYVAICYNIIISSGSPPVIHEYTSYCNTNSNLALSDRLLV